MQGATGSYTGSPLLFSDINDLKTATSCNHFLNANYTVLLAAHKKIKRVENSFSKAL